MPEPSRSSSWQSSFGAAKSFMSKAVNDGMTFNSFYDTMKDAGMSYRRTNMLTDWRSTQNLYKFESILGALDPDKPISARYVSDESHSVHYNYLAGVEYKWTDAVTGKTETGMWMVDSDELSSMNDYVGRAAELFKEGAPYADPTARDFKLRFVVGRLE